LSGERGTKTKKTNKKRADEGLLFSSSAPVPLGVVVDVVGVVHGNVVAVHVRARVIDELHTHVVLGELHSHEAVGVGGPDTARSHTATTATFV